jgi:hypothetical protein
MVPTAAAIDSQAKRLSELDDIVGLWQRLGIAESAKI